MEREYMKDREEEERLRKEVKCLNSAPILSTHFWSYS